MYILTTGYHLHRTLLHSREKSPAEAAKYLQDRWICKDMNVLAVCALFPFPILVDMNINNKQTHSDELKAPGFLITYHEFILKL